MRVLIVGLPSFAGRFKKEIQKFDTKNTYIQLDTYYSRIDRLKAFFLIKHVDVIFSINGSLTESKLFDLAIKHQKKLIFNWVGTDVTLAIQNFNQGTFRQNYIDYPIHLCEVDWIKEELSQIGISAKVQNFVAFEKNVSSQLPQTNRLNFLSYVANSRPEYYGIKRIVACARQLPNVDFNIVGLESYPGLPENVRLHGWVKDMTPFFEASHVCFRFAEHDGLSNFILESLAYGRRVIYNYAYQNCFHFETDEQLIDLVKNIESEFHDENLKVDQDAIHFIKDKFSRNAIFTPLIELFKS